MNLPPFDLERFLARHEFSAKHLLCASDCESLTVGELLRYESGAGGALDNLWLGYTETLGHPALRAEIAKTYQGLSAEDVLVHSGAGEPIYAFMQLFLKAGDHVVVQWPCYQSLHQVAATLGCEVTKWEGDPKKNWELDLSHLKAALSKKTRAVILNQPHNPTGHLMSAQAFREVAKLAEEAGAYLFCDEVYRGLEYDKAKQIPAACEVSSRGISLGVMSKAYGLAGLRIGWIATRNRDVLNTLLQFKDYTTICAAAPSEFLATLALRHAEAILERNRALIQTNLGALDELFGQYPHLFLWNRPEAGCIAFPEFLGTQTSDEFVDDLLQEAGILLAPGSKFAYGERHFRVGYGRKNSLSSIQRFSEYLKTTY